MKTEKKIIAVMGATGAQGGGLVRAIQADPSGEYVARAITRDPTTEAARALARSGVEVVAADVEDVTSLERTFAGAYGAFCVTFFWAHFSADKELVHAQNLAKAARAARVRHAIWSTLEDTRKHVPLADARMPTLQERYKVPHFDAKGQADGFFRELGVPTTFLRTSFYWDNFVHFGMGPKRGADGKLAIALPMGDAKLPGIAAEDIGPCAYALYREPESIGATVGIAGEHLSGAVQAGLRGDLPRGARRRGDARALRGAPLVPRVAREVREPDPARLRRARPRARASPALQSWPSTRAWNRKYGGMHWPTPGGAPGAFVQA